MKTTFDERELLPRVIPSSRHPARTISCDITESDENAGEGLSRALHEVYGTSALPSDKIVVHFRGTAGKGFGSGLGPGVTFVADTIGANGCQNMTGGRAVLLAQPGAGLCKGLSGGIVYVFSGDKELPLASGSFSIRRPNAAEEEFLKALLEEHVLLTKSDHALKILNDWDSARTGFVCITAAA